MKDLREAQAALDQSQGLFSGPMLVPPQQMSRSHGRRILTTRRLETTEE
jgi:hypothetical protein